MAAKVKKAQRTRMTDAEVEKFLKHYSKTRDLKGSEFNKAKDRCAAARWAALERNAGKAKHAKKPAKKSAKKK